MANHNKIKIRDPILARRPLLEAKQLSAIISGNGYRNIFDEKNIFMQVFKSRQIDLWKKWQKYLLSNDMARQKKMELVILKYFLRSVGHSTPRDLWAGYMCLKNERESQNNVDESSPRNQTELGEPRVITSSINFGSRLYTINPLAFFQADEIYCFRMKMKKWRREHLRLDPKLILILKKLSHYFQTKQFSLLEYQKKMNNLSPRRWREKIPEITNQLLQSGWIIESHSSFENQKQNFLLQDYLNSHSDSANIHDKKNNQEQTVSTNAELEWPGSQKKFQEFSLENLKTDDFKVAVDIGYKIASSISQKNIFLELTQRIFNERPNSTMNFLDFTRKFSNLKNSQEYQKLNESINSIPRSLSILSMSESIKIESDFNGLSLSNQFSNKETNLKQKFLDDFSVLLRKTSRGYLVFDSFGMHPLNALVRHSWFSEDIKNNLIKEYQYQKQKSKNKLYFIYESETAKNFGTIFLGLPFKVPRLLISSGVECSDDLSIKDLGITWENNKVSFLNLKTNEAISIFYPSLFSWQIHSNIFFNSLSGLVLSSQVPAAPLGFNIWGEESGWPEIKYKNIIISARRWRIEINKNRLRTLRENPNEILLLLDQHKIPNSFFIVSKDRKIPFHRQFLELSEKKLFSNLFISLFGKENFIFIENSYEDFSNWTNDNQIDYIVPCDVTGLTPQISSDRFSYASIIDPIIAAGDKQMSLYLYCPEDRFDRAIREIFHPLYQEFQIVDERIRAYFVRYVDSEGPHLRLRFVSKVSIKNNRDIFNKIFNILIYWQNQNLCHNFEIKNYQPEFQRYGGGTAFHIHEKYSTLCALEIVDFLNLVQKRRFTSKEIYKKKQIQIIKDWFWILKFSIPNQKDRIDFFKAKIFSGQKPVFNSQERKLLAKDVLTNIKTDRNFIQKRKQIALMIQRLFQDKKSCINLGDFLTSTLHMGANRWESRFIELETDFYRVLMILEFDTKQVPKK